MQKRRSHKKSRRGCLNCKKWHTKCDERGPPCNNCTLRNAKCEYAWAKGSEITALAKSRKLSTSGIDGRCLSEQGTLVMRESRRMLELELMHYWSATTYKSLCSVPEDHQYMQLIMPQEALRYDFMLNGILVAAALHRSMTVPKSEARGYFNVAMELYDSASRSFRIHLGKMNSATHHLLYIFSSMTAYINIAFSQCNFSEGGELNTLSTVAVAFDLLDGSSNIARTDFQGLLDSPVPIRAFLNYGLASTLALHPETRTALSRLERLNEQYHRSKYLPTPAPSDELSLNPGSPTPSDSISMISSRSSASATKWKDAIRLLQLCFAEEQRGVLRGFCFAFPSGAGSDFTAAVKASDPMALLILMHWAVLIERADAEYWWAKDLGPRLTIGIWKVMQFFTPTSLSPVLFSSEWKECVAWVCTQLGIPVLVRI
ncbi:hypothetical protein GGS21DRAFT_45607 [Xylaria nigripes]|nr:hypothetical protein GGS21DRAFT_45607 [Xylaria nigripes]